MLVVYVINYVTCTACFINETYDIVLLAESRLSSKYPNGLLGPNGFYNILRSDRQSTGGGICALISKSDHLTENATNGLCPDLQMCCFDVCYYNTSVRFVNQITKIVWQILFSV